MLHISRAKILQNSSVAKGSIERHLAKMSSGTSAGKKAAGYKAVDDCVKVQTDAASIF